MLLLLLLLADKDGDANGDKNDDDEDDDTAELRVEWSIVSFVEKTDTRGAGDNLTNIEHIFYVIP